LRHLNLKFIDKNNELNIKIYFMIQREILKLEGGKVKDEWVSVLTESISILCRIFTTIIGTSHLVRKHLHSLNYLLCVQFTNNKQFSSKHIGFFFKEKKEGGRGRERERGNITPKKKRKKKRLPN
jgi:hypothetical protein